MCCVRAYVCPRQLNGCEIRKGRKVGVTISHNNHRLFVGNIPKNRDGHQLYQDFDKFARKSRTNRNKSNTNHISPESQNQNPIQTISHEPSKPIQISSSDLFVLNLFKKNCG